MLLDLALRLRPMDSGAFARVAAIEALADRHDSRVAPVLARLLQPHVEQPVRKAVADALEKLHCVGDCTASVLHYLERTSQGETNIEDRGMPHVDGQEGFWDRVQAMLARDQQSVYESLYTVLQQQGAATTYVLVNVYGLGTEAPSRFALQILSRTRLPEACPALMYSQETLEKLQDRDREREDVSAAIRAIGCK